MAQALKTFGALVLLPAVCILRLALSPISRTEKTKPWRRIIGDAVYRWLLSTVPFSTLQALFPSTKAVYTGWVKKNKMPLVVDNLPDAEDAKLYWIGKKDSKKVLLFLHSGGYTLALPEPSCDFWWYVVRQVKKETGVDVGIAILRYGLVPKYHFPTPLRQAVAALSLLLAPSTGRTPDDILLAGESAGANLVMQILLHAANPIPTLPSLPSLAVPPSPLSLSPHKGRKFLGAFMMSPYFDVLARNPACKSYVTNGNSDIIPLHALQNFGKGNMAGIPDPASNPEVAQVLPYLDAYLAPEGFYADLPKVVSSMMIYAGGAESLRDDILQFGEMLKKTTDGKELEVRMVVDEFGVHLDPMLDFFVGIPEDELVPVTKEIVNWFRERVTV